MDKILIVFPVYNEEKILEKKCLEVLNFCQKKFNDEFLFVIANNASKDKTGKIADALEEKYSNIRHFYLKEKGKGIAIKKSWQKYSADYYVFMDIDLSTDLKALPVLLDNLKKNKADLAIGSRYISGAKFERSFFRLIISQTYNLIFRMFFNYPIRDMAIGFKGANKKLIKKIIPLIRNKKWFFDSELVILSFCYGFKVKEIPITWQEFGLRKSKVNVLKVGLEYLIELIKLKIRLIKKRK